ncbi:hypothetical protein [Pararobbsia alpina]|uniref:hypothetical protein n=1 Tax=Pararobbsia alpina TaxID=621374 RepID=UPI0039A76216
MSAPQFECWKKASDSRVGVAGYYFSFKAGGQVACHSHLEARLLAYFEMCPFVVEIRTQYPLWNRESFLAYCREGRMFPRNELMTVDFMLTLKVPGIPHLIYHGVSGKPAAHLKLPNVISRHQREVDELWIWGTSHEVMTEDAVSEVEYESYLRMFSYMKYVELDELEQLMGGARQLSEALLETQADGPASRVVPMVGNILGLNRQTSFRLLAVALFLGHLRWDVQYLFARTEPLKFVRA